ncbi:MAG: single-stranded DNA-binding protein [Lachnospiraceae bacterium]|nr:single-stranded DNA-binding protein [Lachnospiraceae bacterium]
MNSVVLVGRLTGDPEVRYTQTGTAAGNYTLAVDRRYKRDGDPDADFIRCVMFGKSAEFAEKYFHKGMRIAVRGRIQTGSYTNKDGRKIYTTDVIVEDQEFAQSKSEGGSYSKPEEEAPKYGAPDPDGFMHIPDDIDEELPFST